MSPLPYTEDQLVGQPAIGLFAALGWTTYNAYNEFAGAAGSPLLRETKGEVVLAGKLRQALERLNPTPPKDSVFSCSWWRIGIVSFLFVNGLRERI